MTAGMGRRSGARAPSAVRGNLSDEVCAHVRDLIMAGKAQAGEHLRIEMLARDLGVSPTPVREALQALCHEGFLVMRPRRGFVVAPLSSRDLTDIFDLYARISGELAARAASTGGPELTSLLAELHHEHQAAWQSADTDAIETANFAFHRAVHVAAGSQKLLWVLRSLNRYVPRRSYGDIRGWLDVKGTTPDEYHEEVLAAIAAADPVAARATMAIHVRAAAEALLRNLAASAER